MKQEIKDLYRIALIDPKLFSFLDFEPMHESTKSFVDEFAVKINDKVIRIKPIKEFLKTFGAK